MGCRHGPVGVGRSLPGEGRVDKLGCALRGANRNRDGPDSGAGSPPTPPRRHLTSRCTHLLKPRCVLRQTPSLHQPVEVEPLYTRLLMAGSHRGDLYPKIRTAKRGGTEYEMDTSRFGVRVHCHAARRVPSAGTVVEPFGKKASDCRNEQQPPVPSPTAPRFPQRGRGLLLGPPARRITRRSGRESARVAGTQDSRPAAQ